MKRKSFLQRTVAGISLLAAPLSILAKDQKSKRNPKAFKVDSGTDRFGKSISLFEGETRSCSDSKEKIPRVFSDNRQNGSVFQSCE